ncbi:Acetylglutamate kinase, chloroplastic [Capsicum baccatum]|uniref:Acetylglutamate kinase, chloroplastic n=1 Tax=Capsicum baccatum TaxID=33114 RepID=A0A2G2VFL4_CAPBA|nr:Acetylglutamate kinase, chloroplastic [Capsicum baccatum]
MEFGIAKTSLDMNFALQKNEGKSDSQLEYARVLGCLMYIMNCTRLDIAFTISKLSRYTSNPNKIHWMTMKRVLGYLKYTQNYALHYNKYPAVLEVYSDANWITRLNEVKCTSGYVFTIGGEAVSWKSSKKTCIGRSTMESEFIALDKAGEEAEWLQNFLEDIPYWPNPVAPRHNTIRELLSSGIITIDYVKSKNNVLDPLTKGLSREEVERTSKGMGLRPRISQHGGGPEINQCLGKLGIKPKFLNGLRVADASTIEIVPMVLVGKVNKHLVSLINKAGATAVGLSGIDEHLLTARPSPNSELGFVGDIASVDPSVLHTTTGELAAALRDEKLILLTDVAGILEDRNDPGSLVKQIDIKELKKMTDDGKVASGMIPKVSYCVSSMDQVVRTASIIDGRLEH